MRIFRNSVLGVAALAACSACTDTIDEHYQVSGSVPTKSLWEQIVAQPDLKDFAKVLENVHYYSNEAKASKLTYKDILQQNTKFTVWAPVDGSFDLDQVLADIQQDEYSVDHRFVRNHINTFSKGVSGGETDSITMLNTKLGVLNNTDKTFKGVELLETNISATNGLLHKLDTAVTFFDNLYEYMQVNQNLSNLYGYFHERDTTYIDEYQSVQGGIVDGEISWADTVLVTESKAFAYSFQFRGETWNGLAANLKNEDSTYVMVMPTNAGWNDALTKTYPYYQYMSFQYANKDDKYQQPQTVDPDTLQKYQSLMSIVNRLAFSPNQQRDYKLEDFGHTDSLFTTRGEVVDTPYCNEIFKDIEPVQLSNGYAYLSDEYRYNVMSDIEVEGESYGFIYEDGIDVTAGSVKTTTIVNANRNDSIKGSVGGNGYAYAIPSSDYTKPTLPYKLPNVLSGTYDIYAVVLPENIQNKSKKAVPFKFSATLNYYKGDSDAEASMSSVTFTNDTAKVDTVLLFENFHFPVCYKGIQGAYPILTLKSEASRSELGRGEFTNWLYLDKIILKAKEEE